MERHNQDLDDFMNGTAEPKHKRASRETTFTREETRGWALKILAIMASLTRAERDRVLKHAQKVNKV